MTRVMTKVTPPSTPRPHRDAEITDPVDLNIQELIAKGRDRGFLTWEEMNDALPDEAVLPDHAGTPARS